MKHKPAPISRECVSFLKFTSSPQYVTIVRRLFNDYSSDNPQRHAIEDVLQTSAVKFPDDVLIVRLLKRTMGHSIQHLKQAYVLHLVICKLLRISNT